MRVSEILDLVENFSVSGNNATDSEREMFLKYLNLFKSNLYTLIAPINTISHKYQTLLNEEYASDDGITLADNFFNEISVTNIRINSNLAKIQYDDVFKFFYTPENGFSTGNPTSYCIKKDADEDLKMYLYPIPTSNIYINITYYENSGTYTEDTLEKDIFLPVDYHQLLVDGTLWYVYQEEDGFRNSLKASEAKSRMEKGKLDLINYLYNTCRKSSNYNYDLI